MNAIKKKILFVIGLIFCVAPINAQLLRFDGNSETSSLPYEGLQAGYRGFVDVGYAVRLNTQHKDEEGGGFEAYTSHGYQFNKYFFAGIGFGMYVGDYRTLPVYGHLRTDLFKGSVTPFIDAKIGYSLAGMVGIYFAPSIGCLFAISHRCGINLSLGYTMQIDEQGWYADCYGGYDYYGGYYSYGRYGEKPTLSNLSIKLGLDF